MPDTRGVLSRMAFELGERVCGGRRVWEQGPLAGDRLASRPLMGRAALTFSQSSGVLLPLSWVTGAG